GFGCNNRKHQANFTRSALWAAQIAGRISSSRPAQPDIVRPNRGQFVRVQHRHIIYVQGYDPRGLAQYYRMFRTELRKFGRLYQVNTTLGRPQSRSNDEITSGTIETETEGWKTRTTYDFLRFEDFIQRDLASPIWRTVLRAVFFYWRLVFNGTMGRFTRANWRFATFITY